MLEVSTYGTSYRTLCVRCGRSVSLDISRPVAEVDMWLEALAGARTAWPTAGSPHDRGAAIAGDSTPSERSSDWRADRKPLGPARNRRWPCRRHRALLGLGRFINVLSLFMLLFYFFFFARHLAFAIGAMRAAPADMVAPVVDTGTAPRSASSSPVRTRSRSSSD